MERHMTEIVDVDREILMRFDNKDLFEVCFSKSKYSKRLCDETFFRNLSFRKLPEAAVSKPDDMKWKKFYLISSFLKNETPEKIKLFFEEKDKPYFVPWDSKLYLFLDSLKTGGVIEVLLHEIIKPLLIYGMINMENALKIIIMCKILNLRETPGNFLNDYILIANLDPPHLQYVNAQIIKDMDEDIKKNVNAIYKKELGNKLFFQEKD